MLSTVRIWLWFDKLGINNDRYDENINVVSLNIALWKSQLETHHKDEQTKGKHMV